MAKRKLKSFNPNNVTVRPKYIIRDKASDDLVCGRCRPHRIAIIRRGSLSATCWMYTSDEAFRLNRAFVHTWMTEAGIKDHPRNIGTPTKRLEKYKAPNCFEHYKEAGYV